MLTLKEAYKDYFDVGAAVAAHWLDEGAETIKTHFSSITAENEMKYMGLHRHNYERPPFRPGMKFEDIKFPEITDKGEYVHPNTVLDTSSADKVYNFGLDNGIKVRGHCLSWHGSYPMGMFEQLSSEELLANTREHYEFVAKHFPNVSCWDAVNEACDDKHGLYLRETVYKKKLGEDYLYTLYGMAREILPGIPLVCNDYNEWVPHKHESILKLVGSLRERGLVDVIGCQCHISAHMTDEEFDQIKRAYENYAKMGLKIHVTEMDVNCIKWREENIDPSSPETLEKMASVYAKMFALFRQYKGVIENVTLWGVSDKHSWLNHFKNREGLKNSPLLFDENYQPKEAFYRITQF